MFFSYESKYTEMMSKLVDCILLSFFWLVSSLPIITIGASSTAMQFTTEKVIRKNEGKLWPTYWQCFRQEFRQATALWLIKLLVYCVAGSGLYILYYMNTTGYGTHRIVALIALLAVAIFTMWSQYWFPYLAKFTDSIPIILKNTLLIMLGNFFPSIIVTILLTIYVLLFIYGSLHFPLLLFLIPGAHCYISGFFYRKVLNQYVPNDKEDFSNLK